MDHDDLLVSDCLQEVVDAFARCSDVVFVYSDFAQINEDGSYNDSKFNEQHGWKYRDETIDNHHVLTVQSFEAIPHNISLIWYAPNHVRAFRRESYHFAGGYDRNRIVLDDQDLMCRLYSIGDFYHIHKCLYFQRIHCNNTQSIKSLNAQIQKDTIVLYDQYIEKNALSWARRCGFKALDLGSLHNKPEGYLGVDQCSGPGVDLVHTFPARLNLPDHSVGVIRAHDFMEHIADKVALINEIYRLLVPGGLLLSMTPSTDGRGAFQDPTHVAFYNENSFWYYTNNLYRRYVPSITAKFQSSRVVTYFPSQWHRNNMISYVCANLIAIKDGAPRCGGFLYV